LSKSQLNPKKNRRRGVATLLEMAWDAAENSWYAVLQAVCEQIRQSGVDTHAVLFFVSLYEAELLLFRDKKPQEALDVLRKLKEEAPTLEAELECLHVTSHALEALGLLDDAIKHQRELLVRAAHKSISKKCRATYLYAMILFLRKKGQGESKECLKLLGRYIWLTVDTQ